MFRNKKFNFAKKFFEKTRSEAQMGLFITLAPSIFSNKLIASELEAAGKGGRGGGVRA